LLANLENTNFGRVDIESDNVWTPVQLVLGGVPVDFLVSVRQFKDKNNPNIYISEADKNGWPTALHTKDVSTNAFPVLSYRVDQNKVVYTSIKFHGDFLRARTLQQYYLGTDGSETQDPDIILNSDQAKLFETIMEKQPYQSRDGFVVKFNNVVVMKIYIEGIDPTDIDNIWTPVELVLDGVAVDFLVSVRQKKKNGRISEADENGWRTDLHTKDVSTKAFPVLSYQVDQNTLVYVKIKFQRVFHTQRTLQVYYLAEDEDETKDSDITLNSDEAKYFSTVMEKHPGEGKDGFIVKFCDVVVMKLYLEGIPASSEVD
jgi:hypothetical protein